MGHEQGLPIPCLSIDDHCAGPVHFQPVRQVAPALLTLVPRERPQPAGQLVACDQNPAGVILKDGGCLLDGDVRQTTRCRTGGTGGAPGSGPPFFFLAALYFSISSS